MSKLETMRENLFTEVRAWVLAEVAVLLPGLPEVVLAKLEVTPAREAGHGDMASNAALVAAKPAGRNPREIAAALAERLRGRDGVAKAEPAGPGFVNITLQPALLLAQLPVMLAAEERYGQGAARPGPVNVEYVSANPTGPLHVGHCRGAVVGDALANLLRKAGYAVTKEFYVNDAGAQVRALGQAAYYRYLQVLGAVRKADEFAAGLPGGLQYGGDYLVPVGEALAREHGDVFLDAPEDGVAGAVPGFRGGADAGADQAGSGGAAGGA